MYIWVTGRCEHHWLLNNPASILDETGAALSEEMTETKIERKKILQIMPAEGWIAWYKDELGTELYQ